MLFWGVLACAADPLVALGDPLVEVLPGAFAVEVPALTADQPTTLSVATLAPGTTCGFLVAPAGVELPGAVPADAVPVGVAQADADGVAALAYRVPPDAPDVLGLWAVCAVGSALYAAEPARRAVATGAGPA
ncbi:MAG: hypothetical protein R3F59_31730 [Myxococcota bacterium]